MPNPENLKSWKKGQSGNPKGKPKGVEHSKTRLIRLLQIVQKKKNAITGESEEFSVAEQMDMALILKALKGDIKAYAEILDRIEGKATQHIENKNDVPLTIKVMRDDGTASSSQETA
jgi:hypothetical protein